MSWYLISHTAVFDLAVFHLRQILFYMNRIIKVSSEKAFKHSKVIYIYIILYIYIIYTYTCARVTTNLNVPLPGNVGKPYPSCPRG